MFSETKYHRLSHRTYSEEPNTPTWQLLLVGGHPACSQIWDVAGSPSSYQCLCSSGSYLGQNRMYCIKWNIAWEYTKLKVITGSIIFVSILLYKFHQWLLLYYVKIKVTKYNACIMTTEYQTWLMKLIDVNNRHTQFVNLKSRGNEGIYSRPN